MKAQFILAFIMVIATAATGSAAIHWSDVRGTGYWVEPLMLDQSYVRIQDVSPKRAVKAWPAAVEYPAHHYPDGRKPVVVERRVDGDVLTFHSAPVEPGAPFDFDTDKGSWRFVVFHANNQRAVMTQGFKFKGDPHTNPRESRADREMVTYLQRLKSALPGTARIWYVQVNELGEPGIYNVQFREASGSIDRVFYAGNAFKETVFSVATKEFVNPPRGDVYAPAKQWLHENILRDVYPTLRAKDLKTLPVVALVDPQGRLRAAWNYAPYVEEAVITLERAMSPDLASGDVVKVSVDGWRPRAVAFEPAIFPPPPWRYAKQQKRAAEQKARMRASFETRMQGIIRK